MRSSGMLSVLAMAMSGWIASYGQEIETEVPGDNFSLEGALELFKKSASPEEFEKLLNSADSKVNNLDLNGDGHIDYIRVIDRNEGNVHIFIIQAAISQTESQDVAVIELEKLENGKAVLQITGDADVYGMETIIEPTEEVRVNAGTSTVHTVVNVWTWPSVQYVYSPYYSVWVSPWRWEYYPFWWHPWRPVAYYVYDPWWRPYRPYYSVCHSHRIGYMPRLYSPYRRTSVIVYNNHRNQIDRYRSNSGGRNRYEGRDRYDSRDRYDDRSAGNRDRYDSRSVGGRNRYESNSHDNYNSDKRYRPTVNTSGNRTRSNNNNNGNSDYRTKLNSERSIQTPGNTYKQHQVPTDFKGTPSRRQGLLQKQETDEQNQFQRQQSKPTFNEGTRQHQSRPTYNDGNGQQRPSRSSSGGSYNRPSKPTGQEGGNGNGSRGGRGSQRGRH